MPRAALGIARIILFSSLLVAACTPAQPTGAPNAQSADESDATLVASAKQEGELVVVADRTLRPVLDEFERKFGVSITTSPATGSAILDQLSAERAAGRYLLDIHIGSLGTAGRIQTMGAAAPIKTLLYLPDVTDETLWLGGQHFYGDAEGQYNFLWGGPVEQFPMSIIYNTEQVTRQDLDAISSVWDLLNPKWRGRVATEEIQSGLSGWVFPIYSHPEIGPTWLERFWTEMDPTFYTNTRVVLDGLARRSFAWVLTTGSVAREGLTMKSKGLPVDRLIKEVKEARTIPVGQGIEVLDRAPQPNATKLFVNWFLSKEGQTAVHTLADGNPPPSWREDLTRFDTVVPEERREPGKKYELLAAPQFIAKTPEATEWQTRMRSQLIESR